MNIIAFLAISVYLDGAWHLRSIKPFDTQMDCLQTIGLLTNPIEGNPWWPKDKTKIACMDATREHVVIGSMEIGGD